MTRMLAVACVLAAYALPCRAAELVLAEGGQSDYRIVLPVSPTPPVAYAASELQRFVQEMSGAKLPIVADGEPPRPHEIVVGPSRRLELLDKPIDVAGLGYEGYVLQTNADRLFIVGGEPRGTLYGVYGLLDEQFGCRWFTPELSHIPLRPRLAVPGLNQRHVPVFEYREQYLWESYDADWMARNRLNGAGGRGRLLERQGIRPPVGPLDARHGGSIRFGEGFFVHTFGKLVPPADHFAAHPEFFALRGGKRKPTQLCCTNEAVIALCRDAILAGMRSQPESTVFSLSQNDNMDYCQCPNCAALAEAEGSQLGPLLQLVNRVAEATERACPRQIVETLAYQWSRQPCKSLRPRPNVVIRLCDIECCFAHPLASGCTPRNEAFVRDLQAWARCCDRLWIWDYTTDFAHYLLPLPNKRLLDDNIRLFAANHVTGVFEQGTYDTPDSELAALKGYLLARFLWNPQADERTARAEFLDAYFGPAAPAVDRYLDRLHDHADQAPAHVGCFAKIGQGHVTPRLLADADRDWQAAEKAAASAPAVLDRVRRTRLSVDYAIAELGRAAAKLPESRRTADDRAILALAQSRFEPFMQTFLASKLTRIREWKDVDKAEYRRLLAADLGLTK